MPHPSGNGERRSRYELPWGLSQRSPCYRMALRARQGAVGKRKGCKAWAEPWLPPKIQPAIGIVLLVVFIGIVPMLIVRRNCQSDRLRRLKLKAAIPRIKIAHCGSHSRRLVALAGYNEFGRKLFVVVVGIAPCGERFGG